VNVTDTQVSVGTAFEDKTLAKLREFVARVNASTDPTVRDAAFITFNGDLHNGGSPRSSRRLPSRIRTGERPRPSSPR